MLSGAVFINKWGWLPLCCVQPDTAVHTVYWVLPKGILFITIKFACSLCLLIVCYIFTAGISSVLVDCMLYIYCRYIVSAWDHKGVLHWRCFSVFVRFCRCRSVTCVETWVYACNDVDQKLSDPRVRVVRPSCEVCPTLVWGLSQRDPAGNCVLTED